MHQEPKQEHLYHLPERMLLDQSLTRLDLCVYMLIASFMYSTGICFASNEWFANRLGVEERSIRRSITRLVKKGYLERNDSNTGRLLSIKITPMNIIEDSNVRGEDSNVRGEDSNVRKEDSNVRGGGPKCPKREDTNVPILLRATDLKFIPIYTDANKPLKDKAKAIAISNQKCIDKFNEQWKTIDCTIEEAYNACQSYWDTKKEVANWATFLKYLGNKNSLSCFNKKSSTVDNGGNKQVSQQEMEAISLKRAAEQYQDFTKGENKKNVRTRK